MPTSNTTPEETAHGTPSRFTKSVYLSLGSNLGDRAANIRTALERLTGMGINIRRVSSLYRTEPTGFHPQPWFINCVAEAETSLMPLRLLHACQTVERSLGRRRGRIQGPRCIDIDILLYSDVVMRSATLTIPHPRLSERRFVLIPLREIAPFVRHPVSLRTIPEMLRGAFDASQVVRLKGET